MTQELSRRGQPYTPYEDARIRVLPRVPGAVQALALELGRSRIAISMRRSELNGKIKKKDRGEGPRYQRPKRETRPPVPIPVARPAWFTEDVVGLMTARRGI